MTIYSTTTYGPIGKCQACDGTGSRLVLSLGHLPPVNAMRPLGTQPDREDWYPAELVYCPDCHLVQLGFAVEPGILFPPEYPYTSGTTRILRENFLDLYQEVRARIGGAVPTIENEYPTWLQMDSRCRKSST